VVRSNLGLAVVALRDQLLVGFGEPDRARVGHCILSSRIELVGEPHWIAGWAGFEHAEMSDASESASSSNVRAAPQGLALGQRMRAKGRFRVDFLQPGR
jgi:hypothetical protein